MYDAFKNQLPDIDPEETQEWIEALDEVIGASPARARFLLHRIMLHARSRQIGLPAMVSTDYINTVAPDQEPFFPGDEELEGRIRRIIRWNAAAMVSRANKKEDGIGGHLSTYASAASLYEVGFNHFFLGKDAAGGGDQVYIQGHGAPGIYARAWLEGRLTESQLDNFRLESGGGGLSSYPHPRLMPDFWEFPTVSMGLSPLLAIYQARFNRYLQHRGIKDTSRQRVWAFVGDGEMDEPESMAALSIAAREGLDNLIFVVNCNLQRLDGPVRGNGKIIQELESIFRGAGWHVIKVVWGREWDDLLARDSDGVLVNQMNTTLDGDFQKYVVESGAYIRKDFFGDPRLQKMVEHLSDDDLKRLRRGGHDYRKLHAAYATAVELKDAPVVILAKTVKGWALGGAIEGRNVTHQAKKLSEEELRSFRDRLDLPIPDKDIKEGTPSYYHPGEDSDEVRYLRERRTKLGGFLPQRKFTPKTLPQPKEAIFEEFNKGSGKQAVATTMAFVRVLRQLLRDKKIGTRVVPIIPDEARTFGMEALFPEFKIYAAHGQLYEPVDAAHLLAYRESQQGQILEEGITEAGSMGSFTAAGTSYATHSEPMIPFFIFYSMFGFQRIGDFIWSLADQRGRGFLLGATAGRTTLNGEGLQHEDGHSLILASTNPACRSYDPAFAYEIAAIVKEGVRRMTDANEDVFYYLTVYNEPFPQPARPDGVDDQDVLRGLYLFKRAENDHKHKAQILGSGSIMLEALRAQDLLAENHDVSADVWSATSYQQLRGEALRTERRNRLHPEEAPQVSHVQSLLETAEGPVVAVSDFMKAVPDQIARWVPNPFVPLGTDGFGRSDSRKALRRFFEVDAEHIAVATLSALAGAGEIKPEDVTEAIGRYDLDPEKVAPEIADL